MTDRSSTPAQADTDLDRRRRAFALLRELLDVAEHERDGWIARATASDESLAAELRALLAASAANLLDGDASALAARLAGEDVAGALPPGMRIGAWRIVRILGSGGMGVVHLAEREGDGFLQRGALKLIKRGMDSDAVISRFRREREILSRLGHPNIAHLLDGGISERGQPYLVMEYVDGESLADWARRTAAGLDARVTLFLELCDAVAHAHRQLVVHRDIKPGNVVVDAQGHPHLLDFGIAKLLEDDAPPERTATSARFVSRAYAAPEQTGDGPVTTATDVYQLGVLLFELLTDARHGDRPAGSRPSQRLAAARAASGPAPVAARDLRGDAGVIVARATDPDPGRRYATVEAFADDLRRWRSGRPILARPDSSAYRMRLFVRRNRLLAGTAALALAAILAGSALAVWQARKVASEARLARSAQAFLGSVFEAAAPDAAAGERVTARELLDRGSQRIATELADQPRLRGEMLLTIGRLYAQLGQYEPAARLLGEARATLAELAPRSTAATQAALEHVAVARELGRFDEGLRELDDVMSDAQSPELLGRALVERAQLREKQGDFDDALDDARAALQADLARSGARADQARDRQVEALILTRLARFDEAAATFELALADARAAHGDGDTRLAVMLNDYGVALVEAGRTAEAETVLREALDIRRKRLGDEHAAVAETQQVLGAALRAQGRFDEARGAFEEALRVQRQVFGAVHPLVANTLNSLGMLAFAQRQPAAGEPHFREAVAIYRELGQSDLPTAATAANNLATVLVQLGRYDEAEPLMRHALDVHLRQVGEQHPLVMSDLNTIGQLEMRRGDHDRALAHLRRAVRIADSDASPAREGAYVHLSLATVLNRAGRHAEALQECDGVIATLQRLDPNEPRLTAAHGARAEALLGLGRLDEASTLAAATRSARERTQPGDKAGLASLHLLLARIAEARHDPAQGRRERDAARALARSLPSPDPYLLREIERR